MLRLLLQFARSSIVLAIGGLAAGCTASTLPGASGTRESGQSTLMNQTFAGQNACNPKNHERPFIVEWDGTDRSSFEAYASNDVVVVHYEGCELKVLDRCRNDSVRGSLGAYRAVDWTSGSLESIDIASEMDLYAKLPLGAVSLSGRVQGGEKFHMEYYVAGTRSATRDAVYREDLAKIPGCKGATHFVYAYNLGAFALGSAASLATNAEGSVYGFGGTLDKKNARNAEKKGGDLSSCKGNSATEVEGCKSPIRLTLHTVEEGPNPDAAAAKAPDSASSLNKAGQVEARLDMSDDARAHYDSARAKQNARDGKGCIQELDAHDKLDAKNKSTDPKSQLAMTRAQCLMLAGKCEAGKVLVRKSLEQTTASTKSAEQWDTDTQGLAATFCEGGDTSLRDQLLRAIRALQDGSSVAKTSTSACQSAYDTFERLSKQVKPKDDSDLMLQPTTFRSVLYSMVPGCFARAGDCDTAFALFKNNYPQQGLERLDTAAKDRIYEKGFDSSIQSSAPQCKRKK